MPWLTTRLRAEQALWGLFLLCAAVICFSWVKADEARVTAAVANPSSASEPARHSTQSLQRAGLAAQPAAEPGRVLGLLQIPAVGLSVPVVEDDGAESLLRGVGHIRGTALPGGLGTVGLAGHRDTFLRPLQSIGKEMEITVSRGADVYRYRVDSTEVVRPEQVHVLDTVHTPELILITCYPFHYIGAAPMRFIVHAHLESVLPQMHDR